MSGDAEFAELSRALVEVFGEGVDGPLGEDGFNELALRCFAYQFETNPVYAGFAKARGTTPESVTRWQDMPAVPTRGFKAVRLISGDPTRVDKVFRTSGTTAGDDRGAHHVLDLGLYRASLLPNFLAHLVPDGAPLRLVSLIPRAADQDDSSLSYMIGCVAEYLDGAGAGFFVDGAGRIDDDGLRQALATAEADGVPLLVVGTAFALVHWMDTMDERGWSFRLPTGSRIMETGGFKGRSRVLSRAELYATIEERHGVPANMVVNEYGMTELLSQFYEPVMREGADPGLDDRRHVTPPWVRTRVLDPVSLEPVPEGSAGLLCHLDLANVGSVCSVLTEDMGVAVADGFRVLGRARSAEPRGCSLAMDELMSAAASSSGARS